MNNLIESLNKGFEKRYGLNESYDSYNNKANNLALSSLECKKVSPTSNLLDNFALNYTFSIHPEYDIYVFLDGDTPAALLSIGEDYSLDGTELAITALEVANAYRGRGLSKQLLDFAVSKGAVALAVAKDNKLAQKIYKDYGFVVSGSYKDGSLYMTLPKDRKNLKNQSIDRGKGQYKALNEASVRTKPIVIKNVETFNAYMRDVDNSPDRFDIYFWSPKIKKFKADTGFVRVDTERNEAREALKNNIPVVIKLRKDNKPGLAALYYTPAQVGLTDDLVPMNES